MTNGKNGTCRCGCHSLPGMMGLDEKEIRAYRQGAKDAVVLLYNQAARLSDLDSRAAVSLRNAAAEIVVGLDLYPGHRLG